MEPLQKEVRLPWRRGRGYVSVVREHYLRDDIGCKRRTCSLCGEVSGGLRMSATHYLIPDTSTMPHLLEVLEHPAITNVIFLQTCLSHVRRTVGSRAYSRALQLVKTPDKDCVLFSNEHHVESFVQRTNKEGEMEWKVGLVFRAALWYTLHMQASGVSTPVVIVTQHPELYVSLLTASKVEDLLVLSVGEYLSQFCPEIHQLHDLWESLEAALRPGTDGGTFPEHLTHDQIQEGLLKNRLVCGRLRVSSHRPRDEAFVTPHGSSDILIRGSGDRNRAIHGDTVAVSVHDQQCGVVVGILERQSRDYVASFAEASGNERGRCERVLVYPYDIRVPKIRIATRQAEQLRNHRIVVRIDNWDCSSQYPNGHFVRSIGPIGDLETETSVILVENELSCAPFNQSLLDELPTNSAEDPWGVSEEEVGRRRDLRHSHLVFSIDPEGCEDVDDTLSVRHLKKGIIELGVHIADVSYFVAPESLTDIEARHRSTTVYLADRRHDMLPHVLSGDLCSLLSDVDRYAVSVIWRLDRDYHVVDVWYGRTVIRSRYKLAYDVAQMLYDGCNAADVVSRIPKLQTCSDVEAKIAELRTCISSLVEISRTLKNRRTHGGAVELESVEVRVMFSAPSREGKVPSITDLLPKQPMELHETVAECMIFANTWVARKLLECFPSSALLRHHPPPIQDKFEVLQTCCDSKGYQLLTGTNKELAQSLDACVDPDDPQINKILRILATRAMTPAAYFSSGEGPDHSHYGLALDTYTHFTSPIRRYADLMVHRQLLTAIGEAHTSLPSSHRLSELTEHMNNKHRSAQIAQMASTELFQMLYFQGEEGRQRSKVTGVIYAIREHGVMVMVPRYGIRGLMYLRDKNGSVAQPVSGGVVYGAGTLEASAERVTVHYGSAGQYSLRLFDHVTVQVHVDQSHAHAATFALTLVSCEPVKPAPANTAGQAKREMVEWVKAEVQERERPLKWAEQSQYSRSSQSLYSVIQHLRALSLMDDNI